MTRAKEMRDLPLAIDADASGNISLSVGSNLNLDSNLGANSTTAFTSMDGRIFFSNDYSNTPLGANKIVLQNDGNWNSGFGISNNSLDVLIPLIICLSLCFSFKISNDLTYNSEIKDPFQSFHISGPTPFISATVKTSNNFNRSSD